MNPAGENPRVAQVRELACLTTKRHTILAPFVIARDMWEHRNMLENFIRRDVKLQYMNSIAGYFWSLIEPLTLTVIYYIFFTMIVVRPSEAYAFWVIIGVLNWAFFTKTLTTSTASLMSARGIIKQVYFPREIFPVSKMFSNLFITCMSMVVLIPFMIRFDSEFNSNIALIPVGFALTGCLALGLGMALAPFNAKFQDVSHIVRISVRAGFFLSPVMWTIEMAQEGSRAAYLDYILLNPMVIPISMVRSGFTGTSFHVEPFFMWYSVIFCVGSLLFGSMIFYKSESKAVKHL